MSKVEHIRAIRLIKEMGKPKSEVGTYMVRRTTRGKVGEFHAAVVRAESVTDALDIIMNSDEYTLGYWTPRRSELTVSKLSGNNRGIVMRVYKT